MAFVRLLEADPHVKALRSLVLPTSYLNNIY